MRRPHAHRRKERFPRNSSTQRAADSSHPSRAAYRKAAPTSAPDQTDEIVSLLEVDANGRVLVDVKGDLGGGLEREIDTLAGTVVATSAAHNSVRAWMPMANLEALASLSYVRAVRPALQARTNRANPPNVPVAKLRDSSWPQRVARVQAAMQRALKGDRAASLSAPGAATNVGLVQSEGDAAHQADRARKFFNTDGTGVKVGVLSDSDDFKEASIATGDLPSGHGHRAGRGRSTRIW